MMIGDQVLAARVMAGGTTQPIIAMAPPGTLAAAVRRIDGRAA
jgi:hypothetical protein